MQALKFFLILVLFVGATALGFYARLFREQITAAAGNSEASNLLAAQVYKKVAKQFESADLRLKKEEQSYTLLFVGDMMLSRKIDYLMNEFDDFHYPFLKVDEILRSADFTFGNLESPISVRGKNQGSKFSFRADPRAVEGLKFAGFDMVSLANNHIWDWGVEALADTVSILGANGIKSVGAGRNYDEANNPVVAEIGNTKVAFLSYTTLYPKNLFATANRAGVSSFNLENIKKTIKETNSQVDLVVVSLHWGDEYQLRSSPSQQGIAHALIEAGADLIVGHHPHVAQELERYKDGWILYSLGNFIFDQYLWDETKKGLIVKVTIQDKKISSLELKTVKLNGTFQPYIEGVSN